MTGEFKHRTVVKVRFNETDLQGHVNFGHYLFYFDVGLTEYLEAIGCDYKSLIEDGTDMLYAESHSNYKSSARWPEVLDVKTRVAELGRRSIRFDFEITSQADDRLVATGHIVTVTVAIEDGEPCAVPDRLRGAIEAYQGKS